MNWSYAYDTHVWPALVTIAGAILLGGYAWRHRNMPGASFFAISCLLAIIWVAGSIGQAIAIDIPARIFWFKFQGVWQLPTLTCVTCFVLGYAGFGRWLTRRNLIFLTIPPLLFLLLAVTNDYHHLTWKGFQTDEFVGPIRGIANWVVVSYGYILCIVNIVVLLRLAARSPQYRWPVAIIFLAQIDAYTIYMLNAVKTGFLNPPEWIFLMFLLPFSMYALALFRFRVFDPVPLARSAVIEQMHEGMLVLDLNGRVVDLNRAAKVMLREIAPRLRGRYLTEMLPADFHNPSQLDRTAVVQSEISLGTGNAARHYNLNLRPLTAGRGEVVGQLLLLHDITERKLAQTKVVEQQRVVATLEERERLARELHDGIGQVLGYVGIQAQTASKLVQGGNTDKAQSVLCRLTEVVKDAHADVRESILNLRVGSALEWSFVPALKQYLDNFQSNYGIRAELSLSDRIKLDILSPDAEVQLLRVIQEALTNARKHSGAHAVKVIIEQDKKQVHITITDDGRGFNVNQAGTATGSHFGLVFMRERIEQIGGSLKIDSMPGAGTVVELYAPIRDRGGTG
jgi:PAS domain S-box-containing protein